MTTQAAVRTPGIVRTRARAAWRPAVVVLAAVGLFALYWRQSETVAVSSDGAGNVLQAWAILHGNLLLHGWRVSDVSFYTTELPQYALIEAVLGLGAQVVHVGAATTYTVLVLLAALLARGPDSASPPRGDSIPPDPPGRPPREGMAKGGARGRVGWVRALLAAGIMVAPQLSATQIVLLSPDHTGTAVPVLVTWLVIDRAGRARGGGQPLPRGVWGDGVPPGKEERGDSQGGSGGMGPPGEKASSPRGYTVPLVVFVLLTWTMIADSIVLVTCIAPLVLVCLIRACPGLIRHGERPAPRRYELSLAAAAAAAAGGLGSAGPRIIHALGGYQQAPVEPDITVTALQHQAWVTFQAVLELFGANMYGVRPVIEAVFVWLHLAGAIAVVCALGLALARLFRFQDLVIPVFAVAIVFNLVTYMFSAHALDILGAREIAAVLPLGAVLAGRVLAEPLLKLARATRSARRWLLPALAVIAAGYLGTLAYGAAQPPAPLTNQPLASWLVAHGLTDGLAAYWQANSTALASGGRVQVSGVTLAPGGQFVPYEWETGDAGYDPARHDATFLVADGPAQLRWMQSAALRTFGPPRRTYSYDGYTIMVWDANLLRRLGRPGLV